MSRHTTITCDGCEQPIRVRDIGGVAWHVEPFGSFAVTSLPGRSADLGTDYCDACWSRMVRILRTAITANLRPPAEDAEPIVLLPPEEPDADTQL